MSNIELHVCPYDDNQAVIISQQGISIHFPNDVRAWKTKDGAINYLMNCLFYERKELEEVTSQEDKDIIEANIKAIHWKMDLIRPCSF